MKRIVRIVVVVVLVMAGGIYYFARPQSLPAVQGNTSTWKTYTDSTTGFSIKYPSQYTVEASPAPSSEWGSRTLLTVDDNPSSTSSKPRAVPLTVGLQKQPVEANGRVYHTIAEYQQSGAAAQMMQNVPDLNGEFTIVNGIQALLYHIPPAESTGIGGDAYFLIHDDLVYEIGIKRNDPLAFEMLKSITWQK